MPNLLDETRVKYVVNEEERAVAAYVPNTQDDFYNFLQSVTTSEEFEYCQVASGVYTGSRIFPEFPKRFAAVAHCDPRDTFDPEFGKKLALARLVDKHTAACYSRMDSILNNSAKIHDSLADKFGHRIDRENNRAQSLDNWLEKNWPKEGQESNSEPVEETVAAEPTTQVLESEV